MLRIYNFRSKSTYARFSASNFSIQIVTCNFTVAKTRPLRRSAIALVSLSCLLIAAAIAQAQLRGWEWQNPKPQGNLINAIRFAKDKQHGWAAGADGAILRTENGGFRW